MKFLLKRGVTLVELMVVLVVISILSTVAVGIYSKEIVRARYARARQEIRTLEIAITQYEIDTGQVPPSGTGSVFLNAPINYLPGTLGEPQGSGLLQVSLRSSLSTIPTAPLSKRWLGPYIDWDYNRMGDFGGTILSALPTNTNVGQINFLDPWGMPYYFVRSSDYATGGTLLPDTHPFFATETWYNPSTNQIYSLGANRTTLPHPNRGVDEDDITNFRSPEN